MRPSARPSALLALVLAILLGLPSAVRADEGALPPTFAEAARRLAARADAEGFVAEGSVVTGGQTIGTFRLAAERESGAEGARWKFLDLLQVMGTELRHEAVCSAGLLPEEGTDRRAAREAMPEVHFWERTGPGFAVASSGPDGAIERSVEHQGPALVTLASVLHFARLHLGGTGALDCALFNPGWDEEEGDIPIETMGLAFEGKQEWNGRPVLRVTGQRPNGRSLVAVFDPSTRQFLSVVVERPGLQLELRARGAGDAPAPAAEIDFTKPATTPEMAAMRAGYAFATADLGILDDVLHWPSLHARNLETEPGEYGVDEFRKSTLANFEASLEGHPPAMVQMAMKMVQGQLVVEKLGVERARVTFPALMQSMVMEVGRFGEHWKVVRLPDAP